MVELKEIKEQVEKIKAHYEVFLLYANKLTELQKKLDELKDSDGTISQTVESVRLQKQLKEVEKASDEDTVEIYPLLHKSFYELESPIIDYIEQEVKADKHLLQLRKEYQELNERILQITVENNSMLAEKVKKIKKDIEKIGYFKLGEAIADNKTAKILGMTIPSTSAIELYYPIALKLDFPYNMYHEYEKAMKKHKGKKPLFTLMKDNIKRKSVNMD